MTETTLPEAAVQAAIEHMNTDHEKNLLDYAQILADAPWVKSAAITSLDSEGFELLVSDHNGRQETLRLAFAQPVSDISDLRAAFIKLAREADRPVSIQKVSTARVATPKASRYLKALCNHFDRKANASYDNDYGRVQFPYGECEFRAESGFLNMQAIAESETMLHRVEEVVADHLVRFAPDEDLSVEWVATGA